MTSRGADFCTFAGVAIRNMDVAEAVEALLGAAREGESLAVHLCNSFTLSLAARDRGYAATLQHRSMNLPDGAPVAWHHRMQRGGRARGPVRGPALMRGILASTDVRHFFLGGTEDVLTQLGAEARRLNPDVLVCGAIAPPYADLDPAVVSAWAAAIRQAEASVVWVGLGTPKQDEVAALLVEQVDAVVIGVGAAFDFLAGVKREAPSVLHGTGLEWLYRLAYEPGRLWRRYLVGNSVFVVQSVREVARARWSRARRRPER